MHIMFLLFCMATAAPIPVPMAGVLKKQHLIEIRVDNLMHEVEFLMEHHGFYKMENLKRHQKNGTKLNV